MNDDLAAFLDARTIGVLGTTRPNGTPRLATVYFVRGGDTVYISTERTRGKASDVAHTGVASLCVNGSEAPYPSVALEGRAELLKSGAGAWSSTIFERMTGQPLDAPMADDALAEIGRVVIALTVERITGRAWF